ncbi:18488_t:CDS:2, partial [Racocetra fulgida]
MAARFFLGVFESGLAPGVTYYITKWYKKSEQTYRISLFFSGATIAGAFNGLLAFAIAGCAMMVAWGNIGGVISAQIYKSVDAPAYKTGHTIAISFVVVAIILSIIQYYLLNNANKSKLKNPEKFLKKLNGEDVMNLGDLHPSFIY